MVPSIFKGRIFWSRVAIALAVIYVFVVPRPTFISQSVAEFGELFGFVLLSVAPLGRLWCLLFIAGNKNDRLITAGPYSVVRNPLYVFSFVGAVGLGFAVESPGLAVAFSVVFAMGYSFVVRREEAHLRLVHGSAFEAYCASTPRWIPKLHLYSEPTLLTISPARWRQGLLDAMWFLWAYLLWEAAENLMASGVF